MTYTLGDLAAKYGCDLVGDPDIEILGVASLISASKGSISFLTNESYLNQLKETKASAVIINKKFIDSCSTNALISADPYYLYSIILELLHPIPKFKPEISKYAFIGKDISIPSSTYVGPMSSIKGNVSIGESVYIGPGCIIDGNISIDRDTRLIASSTIVNSVKIGKRTTIHPGAVIGADGFGNVRTKKGWKKINQIGDVVIGNDVEIGSNTTIDRGSLDSTTISDGVKLDNLIQIGHNTKIGAHTAIASSTAIAGSSSIGERCMIAGQVGIVGHIEICDDVRINGAAVITKNIKKPGIYSGSIPFEEDQIWKKFVAKFKLSAKK